MIESISSAPAASAPDTGTPAAAAKKTLYHTPFGDVMVDEMSKPDFKELFGGKLYGPTPAAGTAAPAQATFAAPVAPVKGDPRYVPTAQSEFGENVWLESPSGNGPENTHWNYNPIYFATPATAQKIAAQLGGTVVEVNAIAPAGMKQAVPNQMVQMPNGTLLNAGLIAHFYTHGYPQAFIDQLIQNELRGA